MDYESETSRTDLGADQGDKMSSRRKACNECKQQKVRPASSYLNRNKASPNTDYLHSFDVTLPLPKGRIIVVGADVWDLLAESTMAFVEPENGGNAGVRLWRKS